MEKGNPFGETQKDRDAMEQAIKWAMDHTQPSKETRDMIRELNDKLDGIIESKLDKKDYMFHLKIVITIMVALAGGILNLYVFYYSGLSELKVDMGVIKTKVNYISETLDKYELNYPNEKK